MKVEEIKGLVERLPFRPFAVRLNNGAQYKITEPRDIGAPKDYHIIIYFGEKEAVLIDTESIVEIFAQKRPTACRPPPSGITEFARFFAGMDSNEFRIECCL